MSCCLADQERLARLQFCTKESETAIKQLEMCLQVIKESSRNEECTGVGHEISAEVRQLTLENQQLSKEVEKLKEKLIGLEILNAVDQIPVPSSKPPPPQPEVTPVLPTPPPAAAPPNTTAPKEAKSSDDKPAKAKPKKEQQPAQKKTGAPVDVSRLDFRVGLITTAKKHPDADTLYVEEVDVGEDRPRSVCSGIAGKIPLEQMQNRLAVFLCNLKPAKMRGVMSEAMIMCASTPDQIEIIEPPTGCVPGDLVSFEGYPRTPDGQLNPKKKVFEQIQPDLLINANRVACYRGIPFSVGEKGVCTVPSMTGCGIK